MNRWIEGTAVYYGGPRAGQVYSGPLYEAIEVPMQVAESGDGKGLTYKRGIYRCMKVGRRVNKDNPWELEYRYVWRGGEHDDDAAEA